MSITLDYEWPAPPPPPVPTLFPARTRETNFTAEANEAELAAAFDFLRPRVGMSVVDALEALVERVHKRNIAFQTSVLDLCGVDTLQIGSVQSFPHLAHRVAVLPSGPVSFSATAFGPQPFALEPNDAWPAELFPKAPHLLADLDSVACVLEVSRFGVVLRTEDDIDKTGHFEDALPEAVVEVRRRFFEPTTSKAGFRGLVKVGGRVEDVRIAPDGRLARTRWANVSEAFCV